MAAKMAVYSKKVRKSVLRLANSRKCVFKLYILMILELQTSTLLCFSYVSIVAFTN